YWRKLVSTRRWNGSSILPGAKGRCCDRARFSARMWLSPFPLFAGVALRRLPPASAPSCTGDSSCCGLFSRFFALIQSEGCAALLLHRNHKVLHDVIFALRRVLPHIETQYVRSIQLRSVFDTTQPHGRPDELLELGWRYFAKAFEPGNLRTLPQFAGCCVTFSLRVAVSRFVLIANPKQRRLKNEQMAIVNQLVEEPEEVSDHQVANVQAVHIRVRGQDHFLVAQPFQIVLNVEGAHEIVHLVVLIHDVPFEIPDVERFALENKDGLSVYVATT